MDNEANEPEMDDREVSDRREFLRSLGKWSTAAIAAILLSESMPSSEAAGWVNRRGLGVNGAGGWANRSGSWANGGGGWLNSGANWINRGGTWVNGGGG